MIATQEIISHPLEDAHWSSIHWRSIENNIAQLQHRIAKATLERDPRRVRNLQRLLVRSLSARLRAVRQVSQESSEKATPGIDGELWRTPRLKLRAAIELRKRSKTKPLRRIAVTRRDGSLHHLAVPAIVDRARQALWNLALSPAVESTSDPVSYGFRPCRGCWDAYAQIRVVLSCKVSPTWVLRADIEGCFDTPSHGWLLANTPMERKVLSSWLRHGSLRSLGEELSKEAGAPQGGDIAPTLLNHVLNGLHDVLNGLHDVLQDSFPTTQTGPSSRGVRDLSKINLVRHADRLVVTGRSPGQLEQARAVVADFLRPRGLAFHPTRTAIVSVGEGFDFLGWSFRKHSNGKFLGTISKESQRLHQRQIRAIVKDAGNVSPSALIAKLNPIISGWSNYHRCANDIWKVWGSTNQHLFRLLWKWARNRHTRRSRYWIYNKYWKEVAGRRTFLSSLDAAGLASLQRESDTAYKLMQHRFSQLPIHRISGKTNFFLLDRETRDRVREVWSKKQGDREPGIRKSLWRRQEGVCA